MRSMRALAIIGACGAAASATLGDDQGTIELFGQTYQVCRFDTTDIQWEDPLAPGFNVQLIEPEGAGYAAHGTLIVTSNEMDFFLSAKNQIIELNVVEDDQRIASLEFSKLLVVNDEDFGLGGGFDLDPVGAAINTTDSGLAADGNLLVGNKEFETIHGYDIETGDLLEWPDGSGCAGQDCGFSTLPSNEDIEELTFNDELGEIWTIDQDAPFGVRIFSTDGTSLGGFDVAGNVNPDATGEPKALAIYPELDGAQGIPPAFDGLGGVAVVALDDEGPALQAFDFAGNEIALEPLTDDGTPGGTPLLDNGSGGAEPLQIEAFAIDPASGRIFIFNQGDVFIGATYFVLTPLAADDCFADCNDDAQLNVLDFTCFQTLFTAGDPAADCNDDGQLNVLDFTCCQGEFSAGCP